MKILPVLLIACTFAVAGCSGASDASKDSASPSTSSASGPAGKAAAGLPAGLDEGARASESPVDEALAKEGEKLFQTKSCSACHAFGAKATGPDLAGVSQRRTTKWIESQILHPDLMVKSDPIARELFAKHALQMPNQGLTEAEARSVVEFFKHRDRGEGESH